MATEQVLRIAERTFLRNTNFCRISDITLLFLILDLISETKHISYLNLHLNIAEKRDTTAAPIP